MTTLRASLIRLASENPELRPVLLPLITGDSRTATAPRVAQGLQPGDLRLLSRELVVGDGIIPDEMPVDFLPVFYRVREAGLVQAGPRKTWVPTPKGLKLLRTSFPNTFLF